AALGVAERVRFADPQPHHLLTSYYRAAEVVLVPSRSEPLGLAALEAAACGTPAVAAAVGGLRPLVGHRRPGLRRARRGPRAGPAHAAQILANPPLAAALSSAAARRARDYTWSTTAARLRRIYADLAARTPATCDG